MQYALIFATKEELDDAVVALGATRANAMVTSPSGDTTIAQKLEDALASAPLNQQKETVLKTWLAAPEGEWVPYQTVVQAFADNGLGTSSEQATNRASAAIRDLSYQVFRTLPRSDLAGCNKPIEVLAARSRSAGVFSYRLTPAGRVAAERFLSRAESAQ